MSSANRGGSSNDMAATSASSSALQQTTFSVTTVSSASSSSTTTLSSSATSNVSLALASASSTQADQKLPSQEELAKLLATIIQSKESLELELKSGLIKDAATIEQLTGLPQELQRSIDLLQRDLKDIHQFREEIVGECGSIINRLETHISFIESKSTDRQDADHAKTLLAIIKKNYLAFKNELLPKTSQPSVSQTHYLDSERLRLEQQILCSHQETKEAFTAVLQQIAKTNSHYTVPQSCYISYASSYEQTSEEKLLRSFVSQLKVDIRSAGIVANDIQDNLSGNLNEYQEKEIKNANYIIVVGTPALLREHSTGSHQLVGIENKRKADSKCILPILLIGESEAAFPTDFGGGFTTIADWRKSSYQANLKLLLQILYSIGTDNAAYQTFWQPFEDKYAFLTKGLSPETTTKFLAEVAKKQQLEREMEAKTAEQYFQEIKNIISTSGENSTDTKDQKLNNVQVALCKFYSRQNNIANSIDGKEFPIIEVQLSLVTERCGEKNTRDLASAQDSKDSKDAKAQPNANKYYEDWYKAKQTIRVERLFELTPEEQEKDNRTAARKLANKVRVVGPAGIGKTTFTQYVAHKWAIADLWKDRFKYLFWIRLRNLSNYTNEKKITLAEIVFNECFCKNHDVKLT